MVILLWLIALETASSEQPIHATGTVERNRVHPSRIRWRSMVHSATLQALRWVVCALADLILLMPISM
jgi:hypothetical protein